MSKRKVSHLEEDVLALARQWATAVRASLETNRDLRSGTTGERLEKVGRVRRDAERAEMAKQALLATSLRWAEVWALKNPEAR